MKSLIAVLAVSMMLLSAIPNDVSAQEQGSQETPPAASSAPGAPAGGAGMMHGKGMMGRGPMAGCPGMPACAGAGMPCMGMGGGMGMGMGGMGMMDPKTHAEMMQIRGRAMVEMGNLMIKRGKELEQQKPPATAP